MRFVVMVFALSLGTCAALAEVLPAPIAKPRGGVIAGDALAVQKAEEAREMADCSSHWDPGTHMTREAWGRTCKRVHERFRQLDQR